jgi:hypothetical protein
MEVVIGMASGNFSPLPTPYSPLPITTESSPYMTRYYLGSNHH